MIVDSVKDAEKDEGKSDGKIPTSKRNGDVFQPDDVQIVVHNSDSKKAVGILNSNCKNPN